MQEKLKKIKEQAENELNTCNLEKELDNLRVKYLGKKGEITNILKSLKEIEIKERAAIGQIANETRDFLEEKIREKLKIIKNEEFKKKIESEEIDVILPGRKIKLGTRHPLISALEEFEDIFLGLGFEIVEGPEIEESYYNFDALNIPVDHPARDLKDTFYISENLLLRTETSTVQIRVMQEKKPPIRIISPGKVYRSDSVDATHSPMFHQLEGLVVDKNIKFSDLKGTLELVIDKIFKEIFGFENLETRFRPHYFPFTEPSAEIDIKCFACNGTGCKVCKNEGWIELLGCGMVHPKVLKNCKIDPEEYTGFAFAFGLERLAMMLYNINDLRLFYENDLRFLKQF